MSTTLLTAYPIAVSLPSVRFLSEAWWVCHSSPGHTWRDRSDVLIATGEMYTVIPRSIRERLDLAIKPVPGSKGNVPSWIGAACRFGRVTVWLPTEASPGSFRDFALLALLPTNDVPDAPPYILLGSQFFVEYHADLALGYSGPTPTGKLAIP